MLTEDVLSNKKKRTGGIQQSLLPYLLVGSLGAGGGTIGHSLFQPAGLSAEQHKLHIDRVLDKLDALDNRLTDKIEKLEDEIEELKYQHKRETGKIKSDW